MLMMKMRTSETVITTAGVRVSDQYETKMAAAEHSEAIAMV